LTNHGKASQSIARWKHVQRCIFYISIQAGLLHVFAAYNA
jgi:hypothetical protein